MLKITSVYFYFLKLFKVSIRQEPYILDKSEKLKTIMIICHRSVEIIFWSGENCKLIISYSLFMKIIRNCELNFISWIRRILVPVDEG